MEDDLWRRTAFDGRRPLTEDDLWRKTTFDGRWPSIVCIVCYLKKMYTTPHLDIHSTTDPEIISDVLTGNRISHYGRNVRGIMHVHVYLARAYTTWRKTTLDGRQPLMEDDLRWKTTFGGRRPSCLIQFCSELIWKTTFDGRRPSIEDDLR